MIMVLVILNEEYKCRPRAKENKGLWGKIKVWNLMKFHLCFIMHCNKLWNFWWILFVFWFDMLTFETNLLCDLIINIFTILYSLYFVLSRLNILVFILYRFLVCLLAISPTLSTRLTIINIYFQEHSAIFINVAKICGTTD